MRLPEDMEMELRSITDPGYAQPGVFGLPSQRSVDELDRMAAQMEAWVNEQYGPPVQTAVVEPTLAGLPHPLGQVMAAVDKIRAARAGVLPWVATAELAAEVYGLTGEEAADRETSRRLGREISALLTDLRTTTPRYYGPGKTRRGNGYEVAALELAVQEYRATHPRP